MGTLRAWMMDSMRWRIQPSWPERRRSSRRSGRTRVAPSSRTKSSNSWLAYHLSATMSRPGRWGECSSRLSDLPIPELGVGQSPGHHGAVGGGEQVEAQAPEVARVGGAVAVVGPAGELGALDRLTGGTAGHRGGVEQAEPIPPGGGEAGQVADGVGQEPGGGGAGVGCRRVAGV